MQQRLWRRRQGSDQAGPHLGYHVTLALMIHGDAGLSPWPPLICLHSFTLKVTRLFVVPEPNV